MTDEVDDPIAHKERAHVPHSASVASRFWNCAGSIQLSEGIPNRSNAAADRGTCAHELGETCLRDGTDADAHIGEVFNEIEVDRAMATAVQVYLDVVRPYMLPGWTYRIEEKVSLEKLNPPVVMKGTADFTAYHRRLKKLVCVDYKNGVMHVEIRGNKQTRYYALGAYLGFAEGTPVDEVEMVIVQPNSLGGEPVKRETIPFYELMDWGIELIDRVNLTLMPNASLKAGEWCQWCPAKGRCPVRGEALLAEAQIEFADFIAASPPVLPAVTKQNNCKSSRVVLTDEQLGIAFTRISDLRRLADDIEEAVKTSWSNNIPVPFTKRIDSLGDRRWDKGKTESEVVKFMSETLGLDEDRIYVDPKPVTVKQAEIAYVEARKTKGVSKKTLEREFNELAAEMVTRPTGTKIVPESQPGIPLPLPGMEFEPLVPALPSPEDSSTDLIDLI